MDLKVLSICFMAKMQLSQKAEQTFLPNLSSHTEKLAIMKIQDLVSEWLQDVLSQLRNMLIAVLKKKNGKWMPMQVWLNAAEKEEDVIQRFRLYIMIIDLLLPHNFKFSSFSVNFLLYSLSI